MRYLKKNSILCLFILGITAFSTVAGNLTVSEETLRYGLIDRKGKPIIPLQYEYISECKYGLCYYMESGKKGLADSILNALTLPVHEIIHIQENFIVVKTDNKWSVLKEKDFNRIGEGKYDDVSVAYDHVVVQKDSRWGLINSKGELSIPCIFERILDIDYGFVTAQKKDGTWGVLNTSGKELIPFVYDFTKFHRMLNYSGEKRYAIIGLWEDASYGNKAQFCVIDTSGNQLFSDLYHFIGYGGANLITIGNVSEDYKDIRGFGDWSGKVVTPLIYSKVTACKYGGGGIASNGNFEHYYVDSLGKAVLGPFERLSEYYFDNFEGILADGVYYDYAGNKIKDFGRTTLFPSEENKDDFPSEYRHATADIETGMEGFEDEKGDIVIPCKYYHVEDFLYGDHTVVINKNIFGKLKSGVIDINGKVTVPIKYDFCKVIDRKNCVLAKGKKLAFADINGKRHTAFLYEWFESVIDGIYLVKKDKKYGFVTSEGKILVPCIYDEVSKNMLANRILLKNKLMYVRKGKYKGIMSVENIRFVFPCEYDDFKNLNWERRNEEKNRIIAVKDGKCGLFDIDGRELAPCVYDDFLVLKDGSLCARKESGWGLLDENYRPVTSFDYHSIHVFSNNYLIVSKDIN